MDETLSVLCSSQFHTGDRNRGEDYWRDGKVKTLSAGIGGVNGSAKGSSGSLYGLALDFSMLDEGELGVYCDCPRFRKGEACKHLWALFREVDSRYSLNLQGNEHLYLYECESSVAVGPKLPASKLAASQGSQIAGMQTGESIANQRLPSRWQIGLQHAVSVARASVPPPRRSLVSTPMDMQHWFVLSLADMEEGETFLIHIFRSKRTKSGQWSTPTKVTIAESDVFAMSDPDERRAFSLLDWDEGEYNYGYRYDSRCSYLHLKPALLGDSLEALCATGRFGWTEEESRSLTTPHALEFDGNGPWRFYLRVYPNDSEMDRSESDAAPDMLTVVPMLRRTSVDGVLEECDLGSVLGVCESGAVLFESKIGCVDGADVGWLRGWKRAGNLELPREELGRFLDALFEQPVMPNLDLSPSLNVASTSVRPAGKLKLSTPRLEHDKELKADVFFKYGDVEIPLADTRERLWSADANAIVERDLAAETEALAPLGQFAFREVQFRINESEMRIHRKWFGDLVRTLTEAGWEVVADGKLHRSASQFHISVSSGEDWFDLNAEVDFDGQSQSLPTLLAALQRGEKFVLLDDGTHGILPEHWLRRFENASSVGDVDGDAVRFGKNQALMLDMLLAEQEEVSVDRGFSNWCRKLKDFDGIKAAKQPRGFQGDLRPYQETGLGWFKFLQDFQFGGCLADDMGLGKTVQVLALLQSRRLRRLKSGESRKPSLAIVPKSLVFNWIEEARKFAPKLGIVDYTGTDRGNRREQILGCDLVVTTYATFRRDVAQLKDIEFDYAILDEAQAIKNPGAQASKAVRLIKADHRLAMTGTPVENHLGDLWSLFDFLNPGMLGKSTASSFSFEREDEVQRLEALSNALRPFILRRTKSEVLKELPEKNEQTLYCDMLPKQKKLYSELRDHYRASLTSKVNEVGIKRSKIHVLEALLRLRQAACDPRLIDPKSPVAGAKIGLLVEQLEDVISEGHKVLVFSQFTSLLTLLKSELDQRKWKYEYLDGKTTKRAECVQRFQEDPECPLFLISLKAGGHGLNLTAADYVYILDPWWNPAVEAQAIDRAHRMGQQKPVMAYRMIARGTVEDKIVQLQDSKKQLADAIISADQSLIRSLSMEDLQVLFE